MKSIKFCQTTTARKPEELKSTSNLSQILVSLLQPNSHDQLGLFSLGKSTPTGVYAHTWFTFTDENSVITTVWPLICTLCHFTAKCNPN